MIIYKYHENSVIIKCDLKLSMYKSYTYKRIKFKEYNLKLVRN